ncbi:hypothetical protein [Fibrobacter sp. UWB3]|uniref:hypothetical protein n=1 Tax=Fibrobacter sp. UWB3 TaxID=1964357 RepID=UPI000B528B9D|nr:hypothetical protein [Fibrobacter sp. UWB3]OWV20976.1 hypothetical protein B7991_06940 [Fibrobacter sp. UWB3]
MATAKKAVATKKTVVAKKTVKATEVKKAVVATKPAKVRRWGGEAGDLVVDDMIKQLTELKTSMKKFPRGWNGGERFEKGAAELKKIVATNLRAGERLAKKAK